jgi:putative endonuclease
MYFLYILYSSTVGRFYTGSTSNIEKRIYYHNNKRSRFTKNKGPWVLVYSEIYQNKQQAILREKEIKSWKSSKRIIETLGIDLN